MSTLDLQNNLIKNARGLVYKDEGGQRLFLLTQELAGHFTLPGGCKDMEDIDMIAAIKREMKEELGLDQSDYELTDTGIEKTYSNLYPWHSSERFGKDTVIRIFLVRCVNDWLIKTSPEIASAQWFDETQAIQSLTKFHMKELFRLGTELLD